MLAGQKLKREVRAGGPAVPPLANSGYRRLASSRRPLPVIARRWSPTSLGRDCNVALADQDQRREFGQSAMTGSAGVRS